MKVYKNGEKITMSYDDICRDLGFDPSVNFVKVTTANTITFTLGKPSEIRQLLTACRAKGYKPAASLTSAV